MANTLKAVTVILVGLYFMTIDASPIQIPKTHIDLTRCSDSLEDQNIPHESECSQYYRCVYGKKVPKICPDNMLFNPEIGNCDLYYNVNCPTVENTLPDDDDVHEEQNLEEAIEHLTGKSFIRNRKPDDTTVIISAHDEHTTLDEGKINSVTKPNDSATTRFVYIPHENDISAYYKIENGARNLLQCEDGMIFSIELEICVRAWDFE